MSALVVYFTRFGNTQAVAETIAEVLQARTPVRAVSVDKLTPDDLHAADLVVIGSPTHKMNLPKAVRPMMAALPKRILKGKHVAIFDTSYKMSWWLNQFTAAKRLAAKVRKLGGKRILPPETFQVMERQGPLYEGEIERSKRWAEEILKRMSNL